MSVGVVDSAARPTILLVDDDVLVLESLGDYLESKGFATVRFADGAEAERSMRDLGIDAAILDLNLPGLSGLDLLVRIRDELDVPVVILTGFGDVPKAVEAMHRGAYEFQTKPARPEVILAVLGNALENRALARENQVLRAAVTNCSCAQTIVAVSPAMRRVLGMVDRVAGSGISVLVQGETGTGKELVARALHERSGRRRGPFLAVNCAAFSPSLFESTLFGHEQGAFTGATGSYRGDLEQADGGTLFLDEVSSMPLEVQGKLLRVLEDRTFRRLGGATTRTVDVRFVAATNSDLEDEIDSGRFRRDLFYRLGGVQLSLPPLRQRPEDVPLLAMGFLLACGAAMGKTFSGFSERALAELAAHPWPGNVRQLRHVVEHAAIMAVDGVVDHLPALGRAGRPRVGPWEPPALVDGWGPSLAAFEASYLRRLLERCEGNLTAASRISGIPYRTLHRKLKLAGLGRSESREPELEGLRDEA